MGKIITRHTRTRDESDLKAGDREWCGKAGCGAFREWRIKSPNADPHLVPGLWMKQIGYKEYERVSFCEGGLT